MKRPKKVKLIPKQKKDSMRSQREKLAQYNDGYWAFRMKKTTPNNAPLSYIRGWSAAKSEESRRYRLKRKQDKDSNPLP